MNAKIFKGVLLAFVLVAAGCMYGERLTYNVRVDHFEGGDAVVIVFMTLDSRRSWDEWQSGSTPVDQARNILIRVLTARGITDYKVVNSSQLYIRENMYRCGFRLAAAENTLRPLLGQNLPGEDKLPELGK